ncbi:MAG: methyltransferase family protein [Deferrisomatales bacterium]
MPPPLKVFAAFAAYAALHSLLLTPWARLALEALLGPRRFRGVFRAAYVVQAVVLLAAFAAYAAALPDRELARLGGAGAGVLWAVRLGALGFIGRCVAGLGVGSFLGVENLRGWWRGADPPGDGVETGPLVAEGPYRYVRHPMYAAGLVALWAEPRWTANGVAFAVAASLYLWLGALHEERRLTAAHGEAYRRYAAVTPRFWPRWRRRPGAPRR